MSVNRVQVRLPAHDRRRSHLPRARYDEPCPGRLRNSARIFSSADTGLGRDTPNVGSPQQAALRGFVGCVGFVRVFCHYLIIRSTGMKSVRCCVCVLLRSALFNTIRPARNAPMPSTAAVALRDVAQAPVDLHGRIVTPVCAECRHFAARKRLRDAVGSGRCVFRIPQPARFTRPQFHQIGPVLPGPAILRRGLRAA